ncbi:MAG: FtsX-like permease family protein [Synechococcales cyanobacterium RM1_1_8]|nr:FtsX-like permease family protein [Synechococcales cyanobacterium RM1_1_8]
MTLLKTLQRRTPLGWRQLIHDKPRLLTAIAGIAFADILIFLQLGFQGALFYTNTKLPRQLDGDLVIFSTEAVNLMKSYTFSRRRLYQALDVPGVEQAKALYFNTISWRHPETQEKATLQILGQDPEADVLLIPGVNQQRDAIKLPNTVLMDRAAKGDYAEVIAQVEQGQLVQTEIDRNTVSVTGLFNLGASFASDGMLVTSDQTFLRFFPKRDASTVSVGLIDIAETADILQVKRDLAAYLPDDVKVFTAEEYVEFEVNEIKTNSPIGAIFSIGSFMGFAVGVIIVYQVLSTDVSAHMGEYATFRAMGYRQNYLLGVVFEEALIMSILGFIPSVGISFGLYQLTSAATSLPMLMTTARIVGIWVATVAMCVVSGAIATRKLQGADPADIF